MEDERAIEQRTAFFEAGERSADRRAGLVAAMVMNAQRASEDAKVWSAQDFFPYLAPKGDEGESAEMSTAQTVDYLKRGFGLFLPVAYRQRVGLPD